jgi:hypothetical protein
MNSVILYKRHCSIRYGKIVASDGINESIKLLIVPYNCSNPIDQTDCLETGGFCNKGDFGFLKIELLDIKRELDVDTAVVKVIR